MLVRPYHILIGSTVTALTVMALLVPLLLIRNAGDVDQALFDIDLVVLGGVLAGGGVAAFSSWIVHRTRVSLHALATHLAAVRHNSSRAALTSGPLGETPMQALGPLYDEIDALASSYRQALADRVKQRAALEALQTRLGDDFRAGPVTGQRLPGASRALVARLTPNLRWLNATPALLKLLRRTHADIQGRSFFETIHPKFVAELTAQFRDILATGEGRHIEFRFLVRRQPVPGELTGPPLDSRYVRMDAQTRYADDGRPEQVRCFFEDITERVRAERQLRRRTEELSQTNARLLRINADLERLKESYRDLYHNAPMIFFSLDARGHFVACNDTMVQTLGYSREDLTDLPYTFLLPPASAAAWERSRPANAAGDRPHALMADDEVEMQWRKRDGTVIDVWIRSIPVTDEEGRFLRSRSAAQDITQRNRLSNELRRRGDELERANNELRTINKELDDFTSVVSHDLKEPLRTLEAYSNLLAEDFSTQLGPDGFECINHMLMASRRLGKLIDDLLALSRAGRIATAPRVFHLNEAFAVVRRDLGDMIQRKNAMVQTEGALPTVVGDMERVSQLLANLVANGLKYNTQPRPRVVVGEIANPEQPEFVTLFVRDNGIGIDAKYHKEIFGVFRRLHRKEEYEGTGAGLAICKKIVQAHAGQIWVESASGEGATFFFTLPRPPANALSVAPPAEEHEAASAAAGVAAALLLVEDMEEMGLIVQRLARKAGHELHWVTSAEAAWEHLQGHRPDLVLLDIHLPGMDGIELCRRLRAQPQQAELPIALFSQGAHANDISAGLAAGANFVLSKELLCQPEAWHRRLHEVLESSRQQATAQA